MEQNLTKADNVLSQGNIDNLVVTDENHGKIHVINPETSHLGSRYFWEERTNCSNGVITIDDEEGGNDDSPRSAHDDAISKNFCTASGNSPLPEESDTKECSGKGKVPCKSAESMRTYCQSGSSRNCSISDRGTYESDNSEFDLSGSESLRSDSTDSDIMVDSCGDIREQWERAALRKKMETEKIHCLHTENGDIFDAQRYLGEREKHKESDEYKLAAKEEWASRHRQLQIQAEEAQSLRKKRQAESSRLDMEKRQKQRLEEIHELQKKDEETISLKEQLRVEVRKELDKIEKGCTDMASLLRGLGIQVEGGPFPMSREVNSAYKRALLRFHPDRASRADIRQQVEAEEKFKLISRLKEKLLPVA